MKTYMMAQYTPEWWQARRGFPTASQFDKILTPTTCKPSKSQEKYIAELTAELADLRPNFFSDRKCNQAQQHGLDTEREARLWYAMEKPRVQEVGFVLDEARGFGCSPDSLVGDDGVLEIKCPQLDTHVGYVMAPDSLLDDYRCQCHGHLIVTGRAWVDLVSYAPGLPNSPTVIHRVEANAFTKLLAAEVERFVEKYHAFLSKVGLSVPKAVAA